MESHGMKRGGQRPDGQRATDSSTHLLPLELCLFEGHVARIEEGGRGESDRRRLGSYASYVIEEKRIITLCW